MDRYPGRWYKARHRKTLTAAEIEQIVQTSKEPHHRHQDVVQQFRISKTLVGQLISESKKRPEKLEALRLQELRHQTQREAIHQATTKMLENSFPITSAW